MSDPSFSAEAAAFKAACRDGGAPMERVMRSLMDSSAKRLLRDAMRDVRDRDVAEDLVQETFVRVWKHCGQYRGESALVSWMRRILKHCTIDYIRRSRPEVRADLPEAFDADEVAESGMAFPMHAQSAEDEAAQAEVADCLRRKYQAFMEQSPLHATVIRWVVEEGLSGQEVAELLGRNPGATREFISQARKKARRALAECHELAFGDTPGGAA